MALSPQDLPQRTYLCLKKLAPAYKGVELGVSDTVLLKAIAQATGKQLPLLSRSTLTSRPSVGVREQDGPCLERGGAGCQKYTPHEGHCSDHR